MKLTKVQLKEMIRQAVRQQLGESPIEETVYIGSIKKGMAAGKAAANRVDSPSYRSSKGETWEEELGRIDKQAKLKRDMERRFASAGKYWKKVFGEEANVYYMQAQIDVGGPFRVNIKLEERDSFAEQIFVVSLLKTTQTLETKDFGIGIGAKENIARYVKKMKKKFQQGGLSEGHMAKSLRLILRENENRPMKVNKRQLQEMVRLAIRKQLNERHGVYSPDGGMSQNDIAIHLEKEREKKRKSDDVNKKRQATKKSARGMELECGPDMDRRPDRNKEPRKLSDLFADGDRELGEAMYEQSGGTMDDFCSAYIEAALWSSTDDSSGQPLDVNYESADISEETLRKMQSDCDKFQELAGEMIDGREERAGHDFWLTRNGHGSGFADGQWPEYEKELTELSKKFGETWLIVGDNNEIEGM